MNNLIVLPRAISTLPMIPAETGHGYTVEFAMNAFLGGLAENSQATVRHGLRKAADEMGYEDAPLHMVPWDRIGYPELNQLVQRWRGTVSSASIRIYIYSVRGVVKSCMSHNLVHRDQYEPMLDVKAPKGTNRIGLGQYVKEKDRRRMLQSCGEDKRKALGKRDKAMLSILFGSGVRRSEATRLEIQDLNLKEGMFQVVVKGGNLVEKYLAAWAIEPLREWIDELANLNIKSGPILRRMSKGGKPLSPMSPNGLWRALGERCLYAGVPVMKPHDARRTLATDLISEHGLNIAKIALGHSNIATTAIYDMTDQNIMKKIFGKKTG